MSTRLGVLGGMFDPVHNGHVEAASFAMRKLDLSSLHLVPCHIPNHRAQAVSDASARLAMLQLAIADHAGMVVNPFEVNRNQVSYSIDTLQALQASHKDTTFVFVLGMDAFNQIPKWHCWQQLFALCHFFVLARAGEKIDSTTANAISLEQRRVCSSAEMFAMRSGAVWLNDDFRVDLSSTRVRQAIQKQDDLSTLLNSRVIEYIHQHNLYSNQEEIPIDR